MEYAQIPANLLIGEYSDAEILSIVKYQLLFSLLENEPTNNNLNKFLTKKQQNLVQKYVPDIKSYVQKDINSLNKKRDRNARYYRKQKDIEKSQEKNKTSDKPSDGLPNKINKINEINKEDKISSEILSAYKKVYKRELELTEAVNIIIAYWIQNDKEITKHIEDVFAFFKNHYHFKNADKTKPSIKWLFAKQENYFEVLDEYNAEYTSPIENPLEDEIQKYLAEVQG